MNYKIYIESLNNFPIADWAVDAYVGFRDKGADIILFEDIEEVPFSKWHIVVACIEITNKYFERVGIPPKQALNIPEELRQQKFLHRYMMRMTMKDFRFLAHNGDGLGGVPLPMFIKPDGVAKEFVPGIVKSTYDIDMYYHNVPGDSPVLLSVPVNFISEYRGYVYDNQLQGLYWYFGDFRVFPDVKIIDEAIAAYTSQPAGYSIDFGVTSDGRTLLIECNDGWSLGNYGLEPSKYTKLLSKRWLEIMKSY